MDSNLIVLIGLVLNLAATLFLAYRFFRPRESQKLDDVGVVYFYEVSRSNGFLKKQRVLVKGQLMFQGLPIGQPFVLSEQVTEELDSEKIKMLIDNVAQPLTALGVKVIAKGLL